MLTKHIIACVHFKLYPKLLVILTTLSLTLGQANSTEGEELVESHSSLNPCIKWLIAVLLTHFCFPVFVAQFVADSLFQFGCCCPVPFDTVSNATQLNTWDWWGQYMNSNESLLFLLQICKEQVLNMFDD
jgi:hypothetical protein